MTNANTKNTEALRELLIQMKEKHSLSELARQSGISTATLSNIINGKTKSIDKKMWNRVEALVKPRYERTEWPLINTANTKLIFDTCQAAMDERNMKMLIAPTGFGKTTALEAFRRNNSNSTVYVLLEPSMGVRDCLVAIAQAYGISAEGTQHQLVKAITKRMIERGGLLQLDDVGKVIHKFFRILQVIYDHTEGSCGIVIAGVEALRIHLKKNADKQKESYPELISRISWTQPLHAPSAKAVEAICLKQKITDERAINYIYKMSKNYRDVRNIILAAKRLKTEGITAEDIMNVKVGGFYNN